MGVSVTAFASECVGLCTVPGVMETQLHTGPIWVLTLKLAGWYFSRLQEQELLARISDLEADVCSRSNRITNLDHEIHSLNETISTLTRELELKGKEVLRVRSEANQQIRCLISHCEEYPGLLSFLFFYLCCINMSLPRYKK